MSFQRIGKILVDLEKGMLPAHSTVERKDIGLPHVGEKLQVLDLEYKEK